MKLQTLAGVAAMTFALSTGAALADRTCAIDGAKPSSRTTPERLMQMPGYNVGTGAACVNDGSSPSYLRDQQQLQREPGYSIGTGAARVNTD